jgi:hypothetical protein
LFISESDVNTVEVTIKISTGAINEIKFKLLEDTI